jgi:exodeoxyribonuclease-5
VDQGFLPDGSIDANYYRWLYTAFTRAGRQLDLVNWPKKFVQPL